MMKEDGERREFDEVQSVDKACARLVHKELSVEIDELEISGS